MKWPPELSPWLAPSKSIFTLRRIRRIRLKRLIKPLTILQRGSLKSEIDNEIKKAMTRKLKKSRTSTINLRLRRSTAENRPIIKNQCLNYIRGFNICQYGRDEAP